MVFVQKAKTRASLAELDDWSKRLEMAFAAVKDGETDLPRNCSEADFIAEWASFLKQLPATAQPVDQDNGRCGTPGARPRAGDGGGRTSLSRKPARGAGKSNEGGALAE